MAGRRNAHTPLQVGCPNVQISHKMDLAGMSHLPAACCLAQPCPAGERPLSGCQEETLCLAPVNIDAWQHFTQLMAGRIQACQVGLESKRRAPRDEQRRVGARELALQLHQRACQPLQTAQTCMSGQVCWRSSSVKSASAGRRATSSARGAAGAGADLTARSQPLQTAHSIVMMSSAVHAQVCPHLESHGINLKGLAGLAQAT